MPGNRIKTMKALQSRKSNITGHKIHPNSRRAKQLQRVELRARKLEVQGKVQRVTEAKKGEWDTSLFGLFSCLFQVDRHLWFVHSIPEDRTSLSLPELHQTIHDYIHRDEIELVQLAQERQQRSWRKAEPKSKREVELEKQREQEKDEYRTGFVVPDLTLAKNVYLCRQWIRPTPTPKNPHPNKGGDPSFLGRIRLIRINSENQGSVVVAQEGARKGEWEVGEGEVEMEHIQDDDEDRDEVGEEVHVTE
ncbi:BQ2448_620 [Microbotryum intermedium]|uniref:BQ2448_620 protein n=1 Tax=Microbotryum intermedium TaxID=269621 RepID=A0A238F6X9_9BASI|nr:BQ2448_620 [Microbotryum intermedium]